MDGAGATAIDFLECHLRPFASHAAREVVEMLEAYLAGETVIRPIAGTTAGTAYQRRVWRALCKIPRGEVRCYADVAAELASSARAVAAACRANPLPLLIPCHRVVSRHGLGGYMGATSGRPLAIKRWLLEHEGYV